MIKAILFDLDGVLADLCMVHFNAFNKALVEMGRMEIGYDDHLEHFNGLPTRKKIEVLNGRGMGIGDEEAVKLDKLKQSYTQPAVLQLTPDSRIINIVSSLKSDGYLLGCVTNSIRETVTNALTSLEIYDYFDIIISNEDVSKPKPDIEPYQTAIKHLGLSFNDVIIVEDSPKGLQSASKLYCHILHVKDSYSFDLEHITTYIDMLSGY